MVFHVLNRGLARMQTFGKPAVYQTFEVSARAEPCRTAARKSRRYLGSSQTPSSAG
jgi:hypothetical protein